MTTYLNNALASSMIPDRIGLRPAFTLSPEGAVALLTQEAGFTHAGNPSHAPTWQAVAVRLGLPAAAGAKGGRVILKPGDYLLVAEVSGLPRETREFTAEEIGSAKINFRVFLAYSD